MSVSHDLISLFKSRDGASETAKLSVLDAILVLRERTSGGYFLGVGNRGVTRREDAIAAAAGQVLREGFNTHDGSIIRRWGAFE
jgi:hypothetical protein